MPKKIAAYCGVKAVEVLTGFKYIGEQIQILEQAGEAERYIFGFEESCGYLSGTYVRDKDGVNGALLICEMAVYYKQILGQNLIAILNTLYMQYGYCLDTLHSYEFDGVEGFKKMQGIIKKFRELPHSWADEKKSLLSAIIGNLKLRIMVKKGSFVPPKIRCIKIRTGR